MSADTRSTHTDALATLGTIIDATAARDAIHLAVEPADAGQKLYPGQDVCLKDGKAYATAENLVGIVDPFLKWPVQPGERFWLVVYPRQITSLRHVWEHPAFPGARPAVDAAPAKSQADESMDWIRFYADSIDLTYNVLMEGADTWVNSRDQYCKYLVQGGTLEGTYTDPEFWKHYEIVRGVKVPEDRKENFFSCSC